MTDCKYQITVGGETWEESRFSWEGEWRTETDTEKGKRAERRGKEILEGLWKDVQNDRDRKMEKKQSGVNETRGETSFFLKISYFELILGLTEKSKKQYREFLHTSHPAPS